MLILFVTLSQTLKSADFKVVTIQRDTFNLMELSNSSENFFVILIGSYSCFDCFRDVVKTLDSLYKKKNLEYAHSPLECNFPKTTHSFLNRKSVWQNIFYNFVVV